MDPRTEASSMALGDAMVENERKEAVDSKKWRLHKGGGGSAIVMASFVRRSERMAMIDLMVVVGPNFQDAHFSDASISRAQKIKIKRRCQKLEGGTDVCKK